MKSAVDWKEMATQFMKSQEMESFSNGLTEAFKRVMRRMVSLEEEVENIHSSGVKASDKSVVSTSTVATQDWLGVLEQPDEPIPEEMAAKEHDSKMEVREFLTSLAQRVDAMEKNGGMNSKIEGEDISVFFMGIRFSSERDVGSYVRSKSNANFIVPAGLITDCYSIFYELNREIFDSKNKLGVHLQRDIFIE